MYRIIAPLGLAITLSACAITPPTSMFSSLGSNDDRQAQTAKEEVRTEPQAKKEAGIGGFWKTVKSSFGGEEEKPAPVATAPAANTKLETTVNPRELQGLVNNYRIQKGLKPLRFNPKLGDAALAHSKDLAKSDRISHYGSDGSDTWDRVRRTGYQARMTAENVGTGQQSLGEVFQGWQKSRDHNANLLLSDAEEMGLAMVYDPNTQFKTFWTMVLGSPVTNVSSVRQ